MGYDDRLGIATNAIGKTASRIESQIETVKILTQRISRITNINIEHAHQLGFYSPPAPMPSANTPTPVVSSLVDAITDLDQAVEHLDESMNLFN